MTAQPKQRLLVIAPGRGCYNKEELGYLKRLHGDKQDFIAGIDAFRRHEGQKSIAELDAMDKYSFKLHTPGENASALIYACAMADFMDIDRDRFEIVAVTGNSMGWYIALACAGALDEEGAIGVINTMGSMMQDGLIGGQLIYPEMDDNWHTNPAATQMLDALLDEAEATEGCALYTSIHLGGFRVLAGNEAGLKLAEARLPKIDERYPMRLYNHGAFHSPLLTEVSDKGKKLLPKSLFKAPRIPMVDGRGAIWTQYSTDTEKLWDYTLGHQVTEPYDFTAAVQVAVKEFAPDRMMILGPGTTLGGAVAQSLIGCNWFGWHNKAEFSAGQKQSCPMIALGMETQRELGIKPKS
ncbi:ACP S-malonyltransferase [Shewanella sp. 3B26]|uniref:[acyl-carrier-protein] S-malonyltransferase n=1 Tax=Shewanella zhuhaiensis TaxID=2919576 RepID=A0AAJ1BHC4_9GAMM|nr:ACP S-malonyltransferase [Shewanella zhuhaiensis]MCH4294819.1 ACP S-malonyltransferase [Shewanella zhuhaiensis]